MVSEGVFSFICWFCYGYLIVSCAFLTYNIVTKGLLPDKKPGDAKS